MVNNETKERSNITLALDAILDGFWLADKNGKFIEVNDVLCELLGYARAELLQMNIRDIEANETPEATAKHTKMVIEKGYDRFETKYRTKDGHVIDVYISVKYVDVSGGRFYVFAHDITGRKKMEDKVKIFLKAIEGAYDGFVLTDRNGNITYANGSAIRSFAYLPEEMLKLNVSELTADPKDANKIVEEVKNKGKWSGEVISARKNKERFPGVLSVSIIKNDNGEPTGTMGIFRDITERKQIQDAFLVAKDYTDNIIKSMIDALIVVDPDAKITTLNRATLEMLGYKEEELLGKPVGMILAEEEEEDTPFKGTRFKKLLEKGFITNYEMTWKVKSGEQIPVNFSGSVMRDKGGKLVGIVGVVRDMREKKKAEGALKAKMRELEIFYKATMDREKRVIELKEEVKRLKEELAKR